MRKPNEPPQKPSNWYYGAALISSAATPQIVNVTAQQRYPWNGKVDVTFEVVGDVTARQFRNECYEVELRLSCDE